MSLKGTIHDSTWFVTISNHRKNIYITKEQIDAVISELKVRLPTFKIDTGVYENGGQYRQLHWHGLVTLNEWFRFVQNNSILGFNVHWEHLITSDDYLRTQKYMQKQVRNEASQDQVLQENYYRYNYGFTAGTSVAQATQSIA